MARIARIAALATALALTACGDGSGSGAEAPPAPDGSVVVEAGDLYFDPERLEVPAGEVDLALRNVGSVEHDLVIEELDDRPVARAGGGETDTGTVTLEAGEYTYYCSVPGHRNAMEGTLEVG